jgi:antitoxin HigA-1
MIKKIKNIHPGEILSEEFLEPMNITSYRLAKETHIDQTRISEIIKCKRGISIDTALRLSKFFGTSAEFWINLQTHYELEDKKDKLSSKLNKIKYYKEVIKEKVAII